MLCQFSLAEKIFQPLICSGIKLGMKQKDDNRITEKVCQSKPSLKADFTISLYHLIDLESE